MRCLQGLQASKGFPSLHMPTRTSLCGLLKLLSDLCTCQQSDFSRFFDIICHSKATQTSAVPWSDCFEHGHLEFDVLLPCQGRANFQANTLTRRHMHNRKELTRNCTVEAHVAHGTFPLVIWQDVRAISPKFINTQAGRIWLFLCDFCTHLFVLPHAIR